MRDSSKDPSTEASKVTSGNLCAAYLQGFIAGSMVTQRSDSPATDAENETFSERAIRTRAESYVRRHEDRRRQTHCIGDEVPVSVVVEAIVEYLKSQPDEPDITAHAIVHEALVRRFPCAQP